MFGRSYWGDSYFGPRYWGKGAVSLVTVPDVVGQDQASATTEIQGAGLAVVIAIAASSSVPAGFVISQSPASGSQVAPGSQVTITISSGDTATSGGGFYFAFESQQRERRRRKKELEEAAEAAEALQDKVDAEIAKLLHEQQRKDEERANLDRIKRLIAQYPKDKINVERVDKALDRARLKQTLSAYEELEREFARMQEDEDFLIMTMLAMID